MKSKYPRGIAFRMAKIQARDPFYSSYLCFAHAVDGIRMSPRQLRLAFIDLVEPDDYSPEDIDELIEHLEGVITSTAPSPRNLVAGTAQDALEGP